MAACLRAPILVGCAGWNLPKASAEKFPATGTHLERYANRFSAVEINSSFYRPHRQSTYARWASSVPHSFRFAVKVPKAFTHVARLQPEQSAIGKFIEEVSGLGERLGCLLVQLPPSLALDATVAAEFFEALKARKPHGHVAIVCEPRHASWFTEQAAELLERCDVSRVVADPPPVRDAAAPLPPRTKTLYLRLHGSPRVYYSSYSADFLYQSAEQLLASSQAGRASWCIFDNTAEGAATENAIQLEEELERQRA